MASSVNRMVQGKGKTSDETKLPVWGLFIYGKAFTCALSLTILKLRKLPDIVKNIATVDAHGCELMYSAL